MGCGSSKSPDPAIGAPIPAASPINPTSRNDGGRPHPLVLPTAPVSGDFPTLAPSGSANGEDIVDSEAAVYQQLERVWAQMMQNDSDIA